MNENLSNFMKIIMTQIQEAKRIPQTRKLESFHNFYIYQIIMMYTLNILQFCQFYFNEVEKIEKKKKTMPIHIIIKLLKTSAKKKIL